MKAVILAAGRGTRIESLAHGRPKCLLNVAGRSILDWQLDALFAAGVSRVAIVIGHSGEEIVRHVTRRTNARREPIDYIVNPDYDRTNNIYSLHLAKSWVHGHAFLALNADVLCHPWILPPALRAAAQVSMIVDPAWRDETMKVVIRDGYITRMGKEIGPLEASGTYIGITTFASSITGPLFAEIGRLVRQGRTGVFFNTAVQALIGHGLQVGYTSTAGLPWAEIDDPSDYRFASENVAPALLPFADAAPVASHVEILGVA